MLFEGDFMDFCLQCVGGEVETKRVCQNRHTLHIISVKNTYFFISSGKIGIAPCCVQTKALTSTAFLCASSIVLPSSS